MVLLAEVWWLSWYKASCEISGLVPVTVLSICSLQNPLSLQFVKEATKSGKVTDWKSSPANVRNSALIICTVGRLLLPFLFFFKFFQTMVGRLTGPISCPFWWWRFNRIIIVLLKHVDIIFLCLFVFFYILPFYTYLSNISSIFDKVSCEHIFIQMLLCQWKLGQK